LYAGLVKPREVEHDTQIYRAYLKEAERIERNGGSNLRVQLDFELKSQIQKAIYAVRKVAPGLDLSEIKQQVPVAKEDFWKHFAPAVPAKQGVLGDGWRQEPVSQAARPAPSLHPKFTTLLLKYNYPRIRRKEPPSLRTVRHFGPSQILQVTATDTDEMQRRSGMG